MPEAPDVPDPAAETLPDGVDTAALLRRAGRYLPARIAVAHPDGQTTYGELLHDAELLARRLPPSDAGPEPILVLTEHDPTTPEIFFGVLEAGHAVVPVSSRLPDAAIAGIAATVGARVGVAAPQELNRLPGLDAASDSIRWIGSRSSDPIGALPDPASKLPAGTAMVPFTSGTTGRPKGVIITHTNLVAMALTGALVFGLGAVNCQINALPLAHFTGASRIILAVARAGTHVILPEFDPGRVLAAVDRYHGTHLTVAPSMVQDLLRANPEDFDLESLETLIYGTAPMPLPVASELLSRIDCDLINGYGLTESTGLATALDADGHRLAASTGDEEMLGSVGLPVPGIEMRLIDVDGREATPGSVGEITLRGVKVTPGYLNDPKTTAERYLPGGWLRSGDLGRLTADNHLVLTGRADDMIITGGLNIQPLEVENEALRFDGIHACAAFGVDSAKWGQELRLAVVPAAGATIRPEALQRFLRSRMDRYKVPKAVHIVDELPRSALGKVQRSELARTHGS